MKTPWLLKFYLGFSRWFAAAYHLVYRLRALWGKEDKLRLLERAGYSKTHRPSGPLVWLHGASVGECNLALAVIGQWKKIEPDVNFLVTSQTKTSANLLAGRENENIIHQYLPMDTPDAMEHFIHHWQPDLMILLESEIWPNLIVSVRKSQIPLVLLNARMNEKSRRNWQKRNQLSRYLFKQFQWIVAADNPTRDFLSQITGQEILMPGNLKQLMTPLPPDQDLLDELSLLCRGRPVWLALSTHLGEDEILLQAHKQILQKQTETLLILVPRHPERGPQLASMADDLGLSNSRRGKELQAQKQLWIADTIGEIPLWLELASIAFIAGSLSGGKGHNPIEALSASVAVLSGSNVSSFSEIYQELDTHGVVKFCDTPDQIAMAVLAHFDDPDTNRHNQQAMKELIAKRAGALAQQVIPGLLDLRKGKYHARS